MKKPRALVPEDWLRVYHCWPYGRDGDVVVVIAQSIRDARRILKLAGLDVYEDNSSTIIAHKIRRGLVLTGGLDFGPEMFCCVKAE